MTPELPSPSEPLYLADRERPFWGYAEVLLIAAMFLPSIVVGSLAVQAVTRALHGNPKLGLPQLVAQTIGYGIVFFALWLLFTRHGEPLFKSLGWIEYPFRAQHLAAIGLGLAVVVVILGNLLQLPNVQTPFDKLLSDNASRFAIAIFGVTLGPVVEELLFRGFLQPVLCDSFGVLAGILVTSALFGAMHLVQNAFIWQSGVLIMLVGFVLGVIRHVSGSTRASAITHISYNFLPFLVVMLQGNEGH